jgi:predicted amidohydrolase YtcJ
VADGGILDDHVMTVSAERLRTLLPAITVVGGRVVFERAAAR